MAKVHKTYRLDADLVAQVEQWASDHGITQGEAMAQLLSRGLIGSPTDHDEQTPSEPRESPGANTFLVDVLRGNVDDLRAQVATLTNQIEAKDEQIRGLMELAGRAQALQAAEAARALDAGRDTDLEAETITEGDTSPQEPAAGRDDDEPDLEAVDVETSPQNGAHEPARGGLRAWLRDVFGI